MAEPKYFTLRGRDRSVVADEEDADTDPDIKGIFGGLTIAPSVSGYPVIKAATLTPDPSLIMLYPIEARLDDGRLKLNASQADVRLMAKCSVLDIGEKSVVYTVKPHHVTANGSKQDLPAFSFVAPTIPDEWDDDVDGEWVVDWTTVEWIEGAVPVTGGFLIRNVPDDVVAALGGTAAQFMAQGNPIGDPVVLPSAAWGSILGKPAVIAAGANRAAARAAINAVTVLTFDAGWPAREDNGLPVLWVGGDAPDDAPVASIDGDLWFPASGDTDSTKESVLIPTAVKTGAYTAVAGDLVPVDATSGAVAIAITAAPVDGARVAVKKVDASANAVTLTLGGSDVFNKSGGGTALTLSLQNQAAVLQYKATGAIWYVVSPDAPPLSGLDARYQPLDADLTAFAGKTAPTGSVVGTTDTQILTGKTLSLASNTVTMTAAQLQTAVTDADVALTTGQFPPDRLTAGFATLPRWAVTSVTQVLATGTMHLTYFAADKTQTVSGVTVRTGSTAAAATPTLCRIGLFSVAANGDITLIASTASDTALFAAAGTNYTKSFSASASITIGDRLAVGILVVSGAALPTMVGFAPSSIGSAEMAIAPRLSGQVTGLSDLPSSTVAASIAVVATSIYARVA